MWRRYRFHTRSMPDWRPLVYDPRFPHWKSGETLDGTSATIIAWLPAGEPLEKYWDDAFDITVSEEEAIWFTDRFPQPEDFVPYTPEVSHV